MRSFLFKRPTATLTREIWEISKLLSSSSARPTGVLTREIWEISELLSSSSAIDEYESKSNRHGVV